MKDNQLLKYSEQLATDIDFLCKTISGNSNAVFQIRKSSSSACSSPETDLNGNPLKCRRVSHNAFSGVAIIYRTPFSNSVVTPIGNHAADTQRYEKRPNEFSKDRVCRVVIEVTVYTASGISP